MKKSALRKLIRETIREQVGGTQGACIDPCANNYNTPASSYIYSRLANATTLSPSVAAAEGYCFLFNRSRRCYCFW